MDAVLQGRLRLQKSVKENLSVMGGTYNRPRFETSFLQLSNDG